MKVQINYRLILLIFTFFLLIPIVKGQNPDLLLKVQSLEKEYPDASFRRRAYIELMLSEYYWQIDPEKGIEYGRRAISSYQKIGNDSLGNAYVNTAIGFYYLGEMDSCIAYTEEMLSLPNIHLTTRRKGISNNILCIAYRKNGAYEMGLERGKKAIAYFQEYGDSMQIAGTLDNISIIYRIWGKYDKALDYSIKSLRIFESLKDTADIAITLMNIGDLYSITKDYDRALAYLSKAEEMALNHTDYVHIGNLYNDKGLIFKRQGALRKADSLFNKALNIYKKAQFKEGVAVAQQNLGALKVDEAKCKDGLAYLKKSLIFFKSVNYTEDISKVYIDMAKAYNCIQEFDTAIFYLNKAIRNSEALGNPPLKLTSLYELQQSYYNIGYFDSAFQTQKKYYQLKDSLQSVDVEIRIAELQKKYDVEKVQKEAQLYKTQQQAETARAKVFQVVAASLVLFILLAAFFVWQRRKKDREIIRLRQERNQVLKEEMEVKMRFQSKQLTTHALNMLQKNLLLQSLEEDMAEIRKKAKDELKPEIHSLNHKIKTHLKGEKDWDLFKMYFEQINKDFFKALYIINPNLTSNDLRLIALIKLNMNIKEVASVLNLSPDSVKNARYRLRKKLKLSPKDDLFEFINGIA